MKRSEIGSLESTPYPLDFSKLRLVEQSVLITPYGELNITWKFRCGSYSHSIQFYIPEKEIHNSRNWVQHYSQGLILK